MKKKIIMVVLLITIALAIFLFSKNYCILGLGQEGFIGQWWTAPGPHGNIRVCCPLDALCL